MCVVICRRAVWEESGQAVFWKVSGDRTGLVGGKSLLAENWFNCRLIGFGWNAGGI